MTDIEDIPGITAVYREPETVPPVLPDGTETGLAGAPSEGLYLDDVSYQSGFEDGKAVALREAAERVRGREAHAMRQGTWGIEYGDDRFLADVLAILEGPRS